MRILLLSVLVLLSGCSWLFGENRAMLYLSASEAEATRTPEGVTLNTYDRFPVPEIAEGETVTGEFEVPVPNALVVADRDSEPATLSDYRQELNPRFVRDGAGTDTLQLDARFALAWARVADALTATDLTITDLNRSVGIYFLELPNPEAENDDRSWWGRLWGDRIEAVLPYQLKMIEAGEGVYLTLLQDTETLAGPEETRQVLEQVKRQLEK